MKPLIAIALCLGLMGSVGSADLRIVDQQEFHRLWRVAPERMGSTAPPLVVQSGLLIREHGDIWVDHAYSVDADGVPHDYVFYGIEPAGVDPAPFRARVMFFRYHPVQGVPATPVRLHQRERFYMPRPALPGED